jgi:hypothetical protein
MRSRVGGFIGPPRRPVIYYASGMWTLGEQYASRTSNEWPRNFLDVSMSSAYVDATLGSANVYTSISYNLGDGVYPSYVWSKSTNGGSTWSVVAGESSASLSLTGLTSSSNGNLYRIEATFGLRKRVPAPTQIRYESSFTADWYPIQDVEGPVGGTAAFYGQAYSLTGLAYGFIYFNPGWYNPGEIQWQQSTNNGASWTDIAGENTYFLTAFEIQAGMNGRKYRVRARMSPAHAWIDGPSATLIVTT